MGAVAVSLLLTTTLSGTQESYGPWEVRRGRTTDSDTAGGCANWSVTFSGEEDSPDVAIEGDVVSVTVEGDGYTGRLWAAPEAGDDGRAGLTHTDAEGRGLRGEVIAGL